jgi:hypothetical protein
MIDKIRTILAADGVVGGVVGSNIFYDNPPQGQQLPFIIIDMNGGTVNDTKSGASELDQVNIEVTAYGRQLITENTIPGAYTLMEAVRNALDYYDNIVSGTTLFIRSTTPISTIDISIPNKSMMGASMDFEVYEKR